MRALAAAASLLALSVFFVSPLFARIENFGVGDWDWNFFLLEVPRRTLVTYHQIPLWNPYEWGGLPLLGSPWSRILSPSFALVFSLGTVVGMKVDVWLHLLVGLSGTYLLAREKSSSPVSACFAASAYMFAGWFPMVAASGMTTLFGTVSYPWAFFLLHRAREDSRSVVALGAVCALTLFDGAAEPLAILVVALGLHEGVDLALRRTTARRVLAIALGAGVAFAGLSAVKLAPALEMLAAYPRRPLAVGGYSAESLALSLLQRGQSLRTVFPEGDGFWRGGVWGIEETGAYVGVSVLLLALVGLVGRARLHPGNAASLVVFVWMAFGARAPIGPWHLLHALPPFSFMRVPERFRFVFLLDLAMFAGLGLDVLRARIRRAHWLPDVVRHRAAMIASLVAGLTVIDLVTTNRDVLRDAFAIPPVAVPPRDHFVQIFRLPWYSDHGFLNAGDDPPGLGPASSLYPALAAGIGSLRGFDPLVWQSGLPRAHPENRPGYLGEEWLEGTRGAIELVRWTPNVLTFEVTAETHGTLVVNQNFSPGWRSTSAEQPFSADGLLAVSITPGVHRMELSYRPLAVLLGALLSGASLIAMTGWLLTRRHGVTAPT